MNDKHPLILFDGYCNLCNGAVGLVVKYDKEKKFSFASIQSKFGKSLLSGIPLNKQYADSIVYLENENIYLRSTAILRIFKRLGGGWKLLYLFIIIPVFIRDPFYNFIARNRYKWFGKRKHCSMQPPVREIK